METQVNVLERQEVTCQTCEGDGEVPDTSHEGRCTEGYGQMATCGTCKGKKTVPESLESWVARLQGIVRELAKSDRAVRCPYVRDGEPTAGGVISCLYHPCDSEQCQLARIEAAAKATEAK